MKDNRLRQGLAAAAWIVLAGFTLAAGAESADCVKCHADLVKKTVVHPAVQRMGCTACHDQLDTATTPHKLKGGVGKGLSAEAPALCMKCHDRKLFEGKLVHAPVAAGLCTVCHDPHASNQVGLLARDPAAVCLDCHADVKKRPHVIVGFSGGGHPLGDTAKAKEVEDPLRPGKKFYCAACHEPHRSSLPALARFPKGMQTCQKCHNM